MILMTRARATKERLPMHDECSFLGVILPDGDDGEGTAMGFATLASVRRFANDLLPHDITVAVADGEDRAAIESALIGADALH